MSKDVLDNLIVDEEEIINKDLLVEILKKYCKITIKGDFLPEGAFYKLDNTRRLLIYLLSRKVMKFKNIGNAESEACGPKEISDKTGISTGSIKTVLFRIDSTLLKNIDGKYFIPNYSLVRIKEVIKNDN